MYNDTIRDLLADKVAADAERTSGTGSGSVSPHLGFTILPTVQVVCVRSRGCCAGPCHCVLSAPGGRICAVGKGRRQPGCGTHTLQCRIVTQPRHRPRYANWCALFDLVRVVSQEYRAYVQCVY